MDIEHDGLTVVQAAAALGISENALRCRLRDGHTDTPEYLAVRSIEGGRNRWRVILRTSNGPGAGTESGPSADQVQPPAMQQAAIEALRDQWVAPWIARLEARAEEVGMLRGQLIAAEADAERLRAEVATLRSAATSSTPPAAPASTSTPAATSTGWWRRLRR